MIFAANACPLRASAPSPSPPSPPAPTSAPPLQWPPLTPHWPFPTHQQPMRRGGPTPAAATRRLCTSLCCVCGGRVHGGRVLKGWGVCGSRRGWEYAVRTPAARAGPLPVLRTFRASCVACASFRRLLEVGQSRWKGVVLSLPKILASSFLLPSLPYPQPHEQAPIRWLGGASAGPPYKPRHGKRNPQQGTRHKTAMVKDRSLQHSAAHAPSPPSLSQLSLSRKFMKS